MARYFFHLIAPNDSSRDDLGTELPNAEAAYLEAYETALQISYDMLRERRDPSRHTFEITDAQGHILFEIPFVEVMRPANHTPPFGEIHASIQRHQQRATQAIAELKTHFSRAQSLLSSTREMLTKV